MTPSSRHARQDIPTLGKMLLRAIGALEEYDDASEFPVIGPRKPSPTSTPSRRREANDN